MIGLIGRRHRRVNQSRPKATGPASQQFRKSDLAEDERVEICRIQRRHRVLYEVAINVPLRVRHRSLALQARRRREEKRGSG